MQIVIDISEEEYTKLRDGRIAVTTMRNILLDSTPLKTGHWVKTNQFSINQDGQFIYTFICSECNSLTYFRKSNKKAIGANVCPNCGADMRGEQHG